MGRGSVHADECWLIRGISRSGPGMPAVECVILHCATSCSPGGNLAAEWHFRVFRDTSYAYRSVLPRKDGGSETLLDGLVCGELRRVCC